MNSKNKTTALTDFHSYHIITGPPTHSVGGKTSDALWRLSSSVTLHGGPVALRPVRATPCFNLYDQAILLAKRRLILDILGIRNIQSK